VSPALEIWASPEATVARIDAHTYRDQLIETGHDARFGDIDRLADLGIVATRYPVLWERSQPAGAAEPDFSWARPRLERLRERGVEPIVTLLHHGSGPRDTSLVAEDFPQRFAAYAGAAARAFPWIRRWTPINEPLTTARFSTLYGVWYPNLRAHDAFGAAIVNEAEATALALGAIRAHVPQAAYVATEDLQGFTALDAGSEAYATHKRERSFLSVELAMGRIVPGLAMHAYLTERCHVTPDRLRRLAERPAPPALVAWNYYPHSERLLAAGDRNDSAVLTRPIDPRPLLRAQHARLGLPFALGEVHADRDDAARERWLLDRHADLESLAAEGLPARALGAWAAFGMVDWRSLLLRRQAYGEDGAFRLAPASGVPARTCVADAIARLADASRRAGALAR